MIRIAHLSLFFGSHRVLEDLDVDIPTGAKVAVKGESGSGKSSLLRMLLGFVPPSGGQIWYDKLLLGPGTVGQIRRQTSYVPQDLGFTVFPTVRSLFFTPFGLRANRARKPSPGQVKEWLDRLDLPADILDRGIKEISGGQKQRLLLAVAALLGKDYILLDEPSSALDEENRRRTARIFAGLPATVIAATHDELWLEQADMIIDLDRQKTER